MRRMSQSALLFWTTGACRRWLSRPAVHRALVVRCRGSRGTCHVRWCQRSKRSSTVLAFVTLQSTNFTFEHICVCDAHLVAREFHHENQRRIALAFPRSVPSEPLVIPPYSDLVMTGSWKLLPGVQDGSWRFPDCHQESASSAAGDAKGDDGAIGSDPRDDGASDSDPAGDDDHGYTYNEGMTVDSPRNTDTNDRPQSPAVGSTVHGPAFSYISLMDQHIGHRSGDPAYHTLRDST